MIQIQNIAERYFSSDVPELVYTTDSNTDIVVQILDNDNNTVHISTLSPFNGYVKLYELGELFTEYMRKCNLTLCNFTIDVVQGQNSISNTITIIYCTDMPTEPVNDFLTKHFLTLTDVKETQADITEYFHFIGYDTPTITLLTDDDPPLYALLPITNKVNGVTSFSFSLNDLALQADISINKIKGCKVKAGEREFYLFKGIAHDTTVWEFRNAFNAIESFSMPTALTITTKDSHNTAKVNRKLVAYDFKKSQYFESETAPLTRKEFIWASQILASHYIVDKKGRKIIITDAEAEIKVMPGEENKIKFKWQYDFDKPAIDEETMDIYNRIHSEQYDKQYT